MSRPPISQPPKTDEPEPAGGEQRVHARAPLSIEVNLESEHNFYAGITGDVSEGGVFVATVSPPPLGALVELLLTLPDAPEGFHLTGEVCWIRDRWMVNDGSPPGCGIRWVQISPEALRAVSEFVNRRRDSILFEH